MIANAADEAVSDRQNIGSVPSRRQVFPARLTSSSQGSGSSTLSGARAVPG
jgi:hypothetical protein